MSLKSLLEKHEMGYLEEAITTLLHGAFQAGFEAGKSRQHWLIGLSAYAPAPPDVGEAFEQFKEAL